MQVLSVYLLIYPRRLETLNWTRRDKVKSKRSGPNDEVPSLKGRVRRRIDLAKSQQVQIQSFKPTGV